MTQIQFRSFFWGVGALLMASQLAAGSPPLAPESEGKVKQLDFPRAPLPTASSFRLNLAFSLEYEEKGVRGNLLAFSADGKTLAASRSMSSGKEDVALWDVPNRKLIRVLRHGPDGEYAYSAIAFLPPGDRVVTACVQLDDLKPCPWCNKVLLWDTQSGKLLDALDPGRRPHDSISG